MGSALIHALVGSGLHTSTRISKHVAHGSEMAQEMVISLRLIELARLVLHRDTNNNHFRDSCCDVAPAISNVSDSTMLLPGP